MYQTIKLRMTQVEQLVQQGECARAHEIVVDCLEQGLTPADLTNLLSADTRRKLKRHVEEARKA